MTTIADVIASTSEFEPSLIPPALTIDIIGKAFAVRLADGSGKFVHLAANPIQSAYEHASTRRDIILKSRQQGLTTWILARALVRMMRNPNSSYVSVFNTTESALYAELVMRTMCGSVGVEAFGKTMSVAIPNGSQWRGMSANSRVGSGSAINYLHCAEMAYWPQSSYDLLKAIREQLTPTAEQVIESPQSGYSQLFYEEWQTAPEHGFKRHFFPWWDDPSRVAEAPAKADLTDEECGLIVRNGISFEQIGWRRKFIGRLLKLSSKKQAEEQYPEVLPEGWA